MAGFLDRFRREIVHSLRREDAPQDTVDVDDKIALGVLLQTVAQADSKFLPEEKGQIRRVLKDYAQIPDTDIEYVLQAVERAERERIDLFTFTHEISQGLPYPLKKNIIENLFRVACVDGDLAHEEHEIIRKIAGLFHLDHRDFIDAKIKVKKEFGLGT